MKGKAKTLSLVACLLGASVSAQQSSHTLSGKVVSEDEKALCNVEIRAYRDGPIGQRAYSECPGGDYELSFAEGTPIDVRYDLSEHNVGKVDGISGRSNHQVTKTLFSEGSTRSWTLIQVQEAIEAFLWAAVVDRQAEPADRPEHDYRRILFAIDQRLRRLPPDPRLSADEVQELLEGLQNQMRMIRALYGISP